MPERRFRDMRLTEEEVDARLKAYCERTHELMWKYPDGIRYSFTQTGHARAKRLLPLWREWGLRDHYERGAMDVLEELGLKGK